MDEVVLNSLVRLMSRFSGRAAVDSRLVMPGDVFFAMQGQKTDGHHFLCEAAAKGAKAAVVSKTYAGPDCGLALLGVEDPLDALQQIAARLLSQRKTKIVAVTGSLGKTTTKGFISALLKQKYRTGDSPGNSNSQTSLPLTILNHTSGEEEVLVLEMGMTHPGQILRLTQIAPPDIAVITKTAPVHFCNFSSLADISRAKGEILSHPRVSLGIISRDIEVFDEIKHIGTCLKQSFSTTQPDADYYVHEEGKQLKITTPSERVALPSLVVAGKHNLHNFMAAVAVARALGLSWEEIAAAMPLLKLPERRFQEVIKQGVLFINDAYNASVMSMKAALESLPKPKPGGKAIAVLGEMRELGVLSETSHLEVGEFSLEYIDSMICVGEKCKPINEIWRRAKRASCWVMTLDEATMELRRQISPGDVVLVKGANGLCLWRLLESFD